MLKQGSPPRGERTVVGPSGGAYSQRVTVSFEYPVLFTRDLFTPGNPAFAQALTRRENARRHRFFVILDSGVQHHWPRLTEEIAGYARHHAASLDLVAPPEAVPGGEQVKNTEDTAALLWSRFHTLGLDRQSFVVVIGGGAVLDVAGYAAATAHRGLRLVRVPTTVLGMDDSGVGVKNGINAFGAKNFLGTFAPPFAVLCDLRFLETLAPRDLRSGMAEAVKAALIRDADFFHWMKSRVLDLASFQPAALETLIRRCAALHLTHIAGAGDPFEMGSARPLDFGHWAAHKLEALTNHQIRHGEAVAIGIALDSRYSTEIGQLREEDLEAICALLEGLGLPLWHGALLERRADGKPRILDGLAEFREHLGGELCITLLEGIGRGVEVQEVKDHVVVRSCEWLEKRYARR